MKNTDPNNKNHNSADKIKPDDDAAKTGSDSNANKTIPKKKKMENQKVNLISLEER